MLSALVLSAGLGTRLDPLTRLVAKPAVPLGHGALVEQVLDWLRSQDVADIVMNLHHLPATITAVVGDGTHRGLRVRYSWEHPILGSGGGPRKALPLISSDPFIIVNGDTLCGVDLGAMARAHQTTGADVTLAVVPNSAPDRYNGIRAGSQGEVLGFAPKGRADDTWHFVGVQMAAKAVFASLPEGQYADTIAGFYRDIISTDPRRIRVWPVTESFVDVGTPTDYLEACLASTAGVRDVRSDAVSQLNATVDPGRRTVVWSNAVVHPSAELERTIVAGPVHVPAGFKARDAIVVPASLVRPGDAADIRGSLAVFSL